MFPRNRGLPALPRSVIFAAQPGLSPPNVLPLPCSAILPHNRGPPVSFDVPPCSATFATQSGLPPSNVLPLPRSAILPRNRSLTASLECSALQRHLRRAVGASLLNALPLPRSVILPHNRGLHSTKRRSRPRPSLPRGAGAHEGEHPLFGVGAVVLQPSVHDGHQAVDVKGHQIGAVGLGNLTAR